MSRTFKSYRAWQRRQERLDLTLQGDLRVTPAQEGPSFDEQYADFVEEQRDSGWYDDEALTTVDADPEQAPVEDNGVTESFYDLDDRTWGDRLNDAISTPAL